jgi:hypothetical protein
VAAIDSGGDSVALVASHASDLPANPPVVVPNRDEDCSPEAFHSVLDEVMAGPEPDLETIGAADALRELRADAGA